MSEESVKNEMGSLEDVLGLMDRVNEVFSYEVWIPSLKKDVMFREINTNQQKRLIKAIIDSPVHNTEFIFTLRKIIKENCADPDINVDELTILDKMLIAMKMRSVSIGDTLELKIPSDNKDEEPIQRGVSIEKLIKAIKKDVKLPGPKEFKDEKEIYQIKCDIPTILTEYKLEDELRGNVETKDIKDYTELRETIGSVFVGEIVKYIRELAVKDDDKLVKIDLNNISFKNRIALIEKIPERVIKNVIEYIEKVKNEMDKVTLVSVNVGTKEEPKIKEERFSIDSNFFISS